MLYRITVKDIGGRWEFGEIGRAVDHDSTKYFVLLDLGVGKPVELFGMQLTPARRFFFYEHEVEEVANA